MSLAATAPGLISAKEGYRRVATIFNETGTLEAYLAFEGALAAVQGELGIIPPEAAQRIQTVCSKEALDLPALRRDAARVGYPIVPLVNQLAACAGSMGQWVHFGATTQDVMDTALALQIQQAGKVTLRDVKALERALSTLADRNRTTMMIGRSKLQHAVPISFGYKVAVWLDQLIRRRRALAGAIDAASVVEFGGATGTLASLQQEGIKVRAALAQRLNLTEPDISWHVLRDRQADLVYAHAALAAALAKMAIDIAHMMSSEVYELREPAEEGRGSSSTMPQKRNPVLCEAIIEAAREVRELPSRSLDAMLQDHERAIGHGYSERRAVAFAMKETAGSVSLALELVEGLEVDESRMLSNIDGSNGLVYAETAMLYLGKELGRLEAHHVLSNLCNVALRKNIHLTQAIKEAGFAVPDDVFDPKSCLGGQLDMIDRVIGKVHHSEVG